MKTAQEFNALEDLENCGAHKPPTCPYCLQPAKLVDSAKVYKGHRHFGFVWQCAPCDARVGCHKDTHRPLGTLANAELREARNRAHRAFDPLWRDGRMSRIRAYRWLSHQLRIPAKYTHIAMFDLATCQRVIDVCIAREFETVADA